MFDTASNSVNKFYPHNLDVPNEGPQDSVHASQDGALSAPTPSIPTAPFHSGGGYANSALAGSFAAANAFYTTPNDHFLPPSNHFQSNACPRGLFSGVGTSSWVDSPSAYPSSNAATSDNYSSEPIMFSLLIRPDSEGSLDSTWDPASTYTTSSSNYLSGSTLPSSHLGSSTVPLSTWGSSTLPPNNYPLAPSLADNPHHLTDITSFPNSGNHPQPNAPNEHVNGFQNNSQAYSTSPSVGFTNMASFYPLNTGLFQHVFSIPPFQ
ncbi:hypothetical protein FB446DRAFT_795656 [Lentinula raphanica]|nr:hypothetical protein FB446DRAFT_795656 [Lentinula raphanica]